MLDSLRPLVVANWKMHGSVAENNKWFADYLDLSRDIKIDSNTDIIIAPSYVYLGQLQNDIKKLNNNSSLISSGAQDVSEYNNGAYTGQVSVSMLSDFSVKYVILGHSERRTLCQESDILVAKKAEQVLSYGLCAIVCVGESLEQRQSEQTYNTVGRQLAAVLDYCNNNITADNFVVAYEPVWAIGTGEVATPQQAQEVHCFIREQLGKFLSINLSNKIRIIYGGSVKPNNAKDLFSQPDINGGLIGGASLDAKSFIQICAATGR
ncbi:MAG: triose-phosphate isomerase [Gammaproteobacteria bacterium]|nr:triose-phosphate isomerase [Gammaproteobacteria bacterium]